MSFWSRSSGIIHPVREIEQCAATRNHRIAFQAVSSPIPTEIIRDWIGLSLVHGLGSSSFYHLLSRFGSPTEVLQHGRAIRSEISASGNGRLAELENPDRIRKKADQELRALGKIGGRALIREDQEYPELLRQTGQPPPIIYTRGKVELLDQNPVAIVGSRAASSYGRRVSRRLARDLARSGICVVSGLALGIDAHAHTGALDGVGATAAVLGCGLDVRYPRSNRYLYEQIAGHGVLVSEYPLGTPPESFRFPARNRIIAGLSRAVVVVEASKKSGSLITVQCGLEEGRDIFAIPGQVDSIKSEGTHWLLQQGASLALAADDIRMQLGIGPGGCVSQQRRPEPESELTEEAALLFAMIEPYPRSREALLNESALSVPEFTQALLLLELKGLVEFSAGDGVSKTAEPH